MIYSHLVESLNDTKQIIFLLNNLLISMKCARLFESIQTDIS